MVVSNYSLYLIIVTYVFEVMCVHCISMEDILHNTCSSTRFFQTLCSLNHGGTLIGVWYSGSLQTPQGFANGFVDHLGLKSDGNFVNREDSI